MVNRQEHNEHYTMIDNAVLGNVNLSWEARGFLAYLLSLPDDWSFSLGGLVKRTGSSRSVILRMLQELQAAGYVVINRHKDSHGRFTRCTWDIYEHAPIPTAEGEKGIKPPTKPTQTNHSSKTPQVDNSTNGENHIVEKPEYGKPEYGKTTIRKNEPLQSTNKYKVLNIQSTKYTKKQTVIDEVEKMFIEFWAAYPKKVDRKGSLRAFKNIHNLKESFPGIMQALEVQKQSRQWTTDNGQYIPNPTTYIHQERWQTVNEADYIQSLQDGMVMSSLEDFSFWREDNAQ